MDIKMFPTNFFDPFSCPCQSSTIIFLSIQCIVHMLMEQTSKCSLIAKMEVSSYQALIYIENKISVRRLVVFFVVTGVFCFVLFPPSPLTALFNGLCWGVTLQPCPPESASLCEEAEGDL